MAAQPQAVISPFPQPPEYAKQYTDENISKKVVLPPPPVPTEFTVFGEEYNFEEEMIRSLQTQKMQQLFSSTGDWRSELKKLNRSTVAAFLDLLDILIRCPSHPERMEKLNNLRLLFINMHHLINEYRPLQARDTLQLMMKQQIASTEEVIERFRLHLAAGRQALSQCIDEITVFDEIAEDEDMDQTEDIKRSRLILANGESEIEGEKGARSSVDERRRALQRDVALYTLISLSESISGIPHFHSSFGVTYQPNSNMMILWPTCRRELHLCRLQRPILAVSILVLALLPNGPAHR